MSEPTLHTRCGSCHGTGQIPIHTDVIKVLDRLRDLVERDHANIAATHIWTAMPKRWRQSHTIGSVHNHLATLAELGRVTRGPKVGRAFTWTVAA